MLPSELIQEILRHLKPQEMWPLRAASRQFKTEVEYAFIRTMREEEQQIGHGYSLHCSTYRLTCGYCAGYLCGPWLCQYSLENTRDLISSQVEKQDMLGSSSWLMYTPVPIHHSSVLICTRALLSGNSTLWLRFFDKSNPDSTYIDQTITLPKVLSEDGLHTINADGYELSILSKDDLADTRSDARSDCRKLQITRIRISPFMRLRSLAV